VLGLLLLGLAPCSASAAGRELASALALPLAGPPASAAPWAEPAFSGPAPASSTGGDSLATAPGGAPRAAGGGNAPRRARPGLLRGDRLQHAGLSLTLAAGLIVLFHDRAAGGGVTLALGVAKEIWDAGHGGADLVDLLADAAGAAAALVTVRADGRGAR